MKNFSSFWITCSLIFSQSSAKVSTFAMYEYRTWPYQLNCLCQAVYIHGRVGIEDIAGTNGYRTAQEEWRGGTWVSTYSLGQ